MTTESDRLLVQRIRTNDQKAWVELDRRYRGRLTAYVRRRLKDHASVEDVVQETFIGFANSLVNYDDKRDLKEVLSFELWVVSCLGDESRECENDRILPIGCPSRLTRMKKKR